MDGDGGLSLRTWGFLEPPNSSSTLKSHLGLQLMSSMDEKPLFGGGVAGNGVCQHHHAHQSSVMASIGGPYHHHHHRVGGISESQIPMDYWMNHTRESYLNVPLGNRNHGYYQSNYGVSSEALSANFVQVPLPISLANNETAIPREEEITEERATGSSGSRGSVGSGGGLVKKRGGGKVVKSPTKEKKPRTIAPRPPTDESMCSAHRARAPKKHVEVVINGINMDIAGIHVPVCSCTGTPQQCYRWGSGGWQSACCTTSLSQYPLPTNEKRRGARIAGRKMSIGAFRKVLEKLASEGYDFSNPIDLSNYWAKHGTNKFVTIR